MLRYLLPSLATGIALQVGAQCGPCAVSDTCTVDPPFPTVCPAVTPPGTVGVPFSIDVTFWIPPSFAEPTTQLNVILDQVVLNSIENVPLGLTYEASSPSLVYYPQQDPFGCVRVCGTPMEAGSDTIRIHASVHGTVGGIETNQTYDLNLPITIYPASQDTVPDFTMTDTTGCEPITVSFDALMSAAGLSASYAWDFGNGITSSLATPPDQTYAAGDFAVTLTTTFSGVFLTQFSITAVSNAWCGDLDEPNLPFVGCVGQPDLYFSVLDAQLGLSRSPVVNNVQSTTWSNLSIPLGFPPFTLNIYDEDGLSDDDLLGTLSFDATTGAFPFSNSGTTGSRLVQTQVVQAFSYSDTLVVHPLPNTTLSQGPEFLCAADQGLPSYAWTLDGSPVPDETGPCVPLANGLWSVTGISAEGCSTTSSMLVSGVGLREFDDTREALVYPVPTDGALVLRMRGWGDAVVSLLLLDAPGRMIRSERFRSMDNEVIRPIDLSRLDAGTYTMLLRSGERSLSRTVVIAPH
ncbi:MAG: PKD domain-containing protein [Flavobacteriales bacterium]|nr:PKD domain-containing protein [Flavobacteriales bacterium]